MPRDASGNYTLPAGNPVVSGTIITADWANATMPDLGNEITDSLSRSGEGGMLAPLKHADGSELVPSVTFLNDIQSGLYLAAANQVVMSIAGTDLMRWSSGTVEIWDGAAWQPISGVTFFPGNDPDLAGDDGAIQIGGVDVSGEFIAIGPTTIQAKDGPTGVSTFLDLNPLGGSVRIGPVSSGAGVVQLFFDGAEKLRTQQYGARFFGETAANPSSSGEQDCILILANSINNTASHFGHPAISQDLEIKNFVHAGHVLIKGEDALGNEVIMLRADPNLVNTTEGGIESQHGRFTKVSAGSASLIDNDQAIITGDIDANNMTISQSAIMARDNGAASDLFLQPIAGASVYVGALTNAFVLCNDVQTALHHGDAEQVARTIARTAGGLEIFNTFTGTGPERALTVSDLMAYEAALALDNDFSAGTATVLATRVSNGYWVTVEISQALHTSASSADTTALIPAAYRPKNASAEEVVHFGGSFLTSIAVSQTGVISMNHRDWSGVLYSTPGIGTRVSMTYFVAD